MSHVKFKRQKIMSQNNLTASSGNSDLNSTRMGDTISNETMSSTNTSIANSNESLGFGFESMSSADQEMEDTSDKYVASIQVKGYTPFRLNEIIPGRPWPKNIQELISSPIAESSSATTATATATALAPEPEPRPERQITLTELTALLCHRALVEVGFVPENENSQLPPLTICTMSDAERLERFGKRVNPKGYNSAAAVFAWTYQVVNLISCENDVKPEAKDKVLKDESFQKMKSETASSKEDSEENIGDEIMDTLKKEGLRNENKFQLSPPCSIIIIPKGAKVQIFCNFPGSPTAGTKPFQQTADVDLRPCMESSIVGPENLRLTAREWMKVANLNGSRFSSCFKCSFATLCLDAMSGVMFDIRGLVCLPPEILIRVFSYCDLLSIRNTRLTCRYLNDVVDIPGLWRALIRRDFGAAPSVPTARFARFFTRIPYDLSHNIFDAPSDYRAIFEAHRRSSFRPRFEALGGLSNRLGGRMSWIPYVTPPPRPFLFRNLSYDIPPPPTAHNAVNLFFDL